MKHFFFVLSFGTLAIANAQRPEVLIGNDYESISGFGGVLLSFSSLGGKTASYTGGGGAVLLDNTFYFGGYGMGLNDDRKVTVDDTMYDVDFGHGGFMLGYNIKPAQLVHLGISSKLGWGSMEYNSLNNAINDVNDQVFVVTPQVEAEFNMTHWFKFNVGVGYQQVIGMDDFFYNEKDVSGPAVGVSFLFGWFY